MTERAERAEPAGRPEPGQGPNRPKRPERPERRLRPKLRHRAPANFLRWALNYRGQRRAIGRGYLFDALRFVTPSVAIETDGLRVYLSTADRVVSRRIFAGGLWERPMFELVMAELADRGLGAALDGKIFLDIGANIGTASCHAITGHRAALALAFEPAPQNLRFLRQNIVANELEGRVRIHACALSDRDGHVSFELSDVNSGDHRVRTATAGEQPALLGESSWSTTRVESRRLDSYVEDGTIALDRVGLAWIDVQGHEGHVFGGAGRLLSSQVPVVCEYWPYALRRAGGFERFRDELEGRRSNFVDLAKPAEGPQPISSLAALADNLARPDASTDLLLLP
jgi:FkbM family methyltransferase